MTEETLIILDPGLGATIQAGPRVGWKKYGVPPGGPMDVHAASWANRLLDNPAMAPVLELALQGARMEVARDGWFAVTGADASATVETWKALHLRAGERMAFPRHRSGVWTYVAVAGGFAAPSVLGSASTYVRAGLGIVGSAGTRLSRVQQGKFDLPAGVATRLAPALERRDYSHPPPLRVWPGPQASWFAASERSEFFLRHWTVSSQSDRVGYRLLGRPLAVSSAQLWSEPVRVGTVQVPENGLPIVTMRDGPTAGGYAKLGLLNPDDLSWLAQCRPGQEVRFRAMDEAGPEL